MMKKIFTSNIGWGLIISIILISNKLPLLAIKDYPVIYYILLTHIIICGIILGLSYKIGDFTTKDVVNRLIFALALIMFFKLALHEASTYWVTIEERLQILLHLTEILGILLALLANDDYFMVMDLSSNYYREHLKSIFIPTLYMEDKDNSYSGKGKRRATDSNIDSSKSNSPQPGSIANSPQPGSEDNSPQLISQSKTAIEASPQVTAGPSVPPVVAQPPRLVEPPVHQVLPINPVRGPIQGMHQARTVVHSRFYTPEGIYEIHRYLVQNPPIEGPGARFLSILDPQGQASRGFNPGGTNQPFARNLADALRNHYSRRGVLSSRTFPDQDTKRWFVDFLRHHHHGLYNRVTNNGTNNSINFGSAHNIRNNVSLRTSLENLD